MGRFYGRVGYSETVESFEGSQVWIDKITERRYFGEVINYKTRWQSSQNLNDDLKPSTTIEILADEYAYEHFSRIKYVEWMGVLWKVTDVAPRRPRLVLTLGGEYNGEQTESGSGADECSCQH